MSHKTESNLSKFFIAGINYKKTDASIRGQFAINNEQYANILNLAPQFGIAECFILSTCNRTEIYGFADNVSQLINILCTETIGTKETFVELCYTRKGKEAVQHLFEVGAGLESQILGDYEIIGQIKMSVKVAKQYGFVGSFTERLVNSVLQSTKVIKNQTALSGGTVSVSFAAVQYIKRSVAKVADKKILLVGVGKIGRNTCKNIVDYLGATNLTLINRSEDKAAELACELCLQHAHIDDLPEQIKSSDIILIATNANEPVVLSSHLKGAGKKLVIDLSIPYNVEVEAGELSNITLVNVDDLSKLKDETLQKREAEVPKAKEIIAGHKAEFLEWNELRRNAPVIRAVKQKLFDMHQCQMFLSAYKSVSTTADITSTTVTDNTIITSGKTCSELAINQFVIQKVIKNMAVKMRKQHQPGCSYIEAINDFITSHRN
jgi:glutamyl-tRNA reductase